MSQEIICEFDPMLYVSHRKSCLWDLIAILCERSEKECDEFVSKARVSDDVGEIESLIHEVGARLGVRVIVRPRRG